MSFDIAFMFALTIALLLGVIVYLIDQLIKAKDRQIDRLQSELDALVNRKRHTGPTMAGLEDVRAVIENLRHNRIIEDDLLDACANTLGKLRQGPYAYDPETPSGKREGFK